MTRDELESASDHLESAAKVAGDDDVSERLASLSEKLATWATADRGPDHGQLARVENRLHSLKDDADAALLDDVNAAHDLVQEYRSGVEGI